MRLTLCLLLASLFPASGGILFRDSFDRADSRNIQQSLDGIANHTGTAFEAGGDPAGTPVYLHSHIDPASGFAGGFAVPDTIAANGGAARISGNTLNLAAEQPGTSNAIVNHNFTNPAILAAGGFSVSLDVDTREGNSNGNGGGFAIGMPMAEAMTTGDANDGDPRMTGGFATAIHAATVIPAAVVSDFWIVLRSNGSLAWGGGAGTTGISGITGLGSNLAGNITVNFSLESFDAGDTVNYEILFNDMPRGTGSFVWKGSNENHIGLEGRSANGPLLDNFTIRTLASSATLAVAPETVAHDNAAQTVTLSWNASGLPAGAAYEITADKAVAFPNADASGPAANGGHTVEAMVDGTLGDTTFTLEISAGETVIATSSATVRQIPPLSTRPNVVVILVDDLGWSDLGCYGGEIPTPHLDALAANGVRFRQFYQGTRCSPTRISLLTGLYPQQGAVNPAAALPDLRTDNNVTFAEVLGYEGYRTYMAGKWHLGNGERLPENRGFQHVWRFANGQAHSTDQWNQSACTLVSQNNEIALRDYGAAFYQPDAMGDYALDFIDHHLAKNDGASFAMYLAFGAPHFPIQAPAALADAYVPTYAQGWDIIRQQRYDRQLAMGVIDSRYPLSSRGGTGPHQAEPIVAIPSWNTLGADRCADLARRMALFAAMVQKIDDNVGKLVAKLDQTGRLDNTLIFFLSDNGANHEGGVFGNNNAAPATGAALANMGQAGENDNIHYGGGWANAGNTPLKLFKHFTHEGGIRAPLIVHWPAGFSSRGNWIETPAHLIDVMDSIVDATGATYPAAFNGNPVLPLEGTSLISMIDGAVPDRALFVEHESNRMARKGKWKLVTEAFTAFDNEFTAHQKLLYDMDADPGESTDIAAQHPAKVVELVDEWNAWATRVGLPAGRLIAPPPENVTPASTPADLFLDTFNRPNATDIDTSNEGMSGSRVPPLGEGVTWFEGFQGSGEGSIQIADGILQMATGTGMSENGLNHNFTGQDILDAGGFSVSLRILDINSDPTDLANRFVGFGVGLNAAEAAAGNDIGSANPKPIRGNAANPGAADCFLELDLNGNVKLWTVGVLRATVPVGKTRGTLTAAFVCDSFAAGSTVAVSAYFDGERVDLDPAGPSMHRTFTWNESNANHIALSARAANHAQMDNFAVRRLPVSAALSIERALGAGLDGVLTAPSADPDGDGLDNFGEWAFGADPARADREVAATSLLLVQPESDLFRFAHRRLAGHMAAGVSYLYQISEDLDGWHDIVPLEESATALPASPGYEAVTLRLPQGEWAEKTRLFLQISAASF